MRNGSLRAVVAAVLFGLVVIVIPLETSPAPGLVPPHRPDVVVILTDDQRWDTLWAMPNVQSLLVSQGVTFANSFVVNSSCCPSRTTLLTGDYSHTTGVYTNLARDHGGFASFDDASTLATLLQGAGYRTALIGKYLNGYPVKSSYVPPGWDRWFATGSDQGGYYNYTVNDQGNPVFFGSGDTNYSTDVYAGESVAFIQGVPKETPLFLEFAPHAPHSPSTPPSRYLTAFSDLPPWRPPSFNEADVSDKPAYVQARPLITHGGALRTQQYRTLLAVDDAVGAIVDALTAAGRLSNTVILFASDNGLMWGEHRLGNVKYAPYEESIRVPLIIRYDPLTTAKTDTHLVANIDYAPTIAELAGVAAPPMDGESLVPLLLEDSGSSWRQDFLIEHLSPLAPPYCAVREPGYIYVLYATGEEELYDLAADPYELVNVATDPTYASRRASMSARLAELCIPPPPRFPG